MSRRHIMKTLINNVLNNRASGLLVTALPNYLVAGAVSCVWPDSTSIAMSLATAFSSTHVVGEVVDRVLRKVNPTLVCKHTMGTAAWAATLDGGFNAPTQEALLAYKYGDGLVQEGADVVSFGAHNQGVYAAMKQGQFIAGTVSTKSIAIPYSKFVTCITSVAFNSSAFYSKSYGKGVEVTVDRAYVNSRIGDFQACDASNENGPIMPLLSFLVSMKPVSIRTAMARLKVLHTQAQDIK